MHPAAACSILLALHIQGGSHVVQQAAYDDRIAWVLPPDKLAAFARSGVVIDEDKKTRIIVTTTASKSAHDIVTLHGTLNTTTVDVPRHRATHSIVAFTNTVTPRNDPLPAAAIDVEQAAMADLPVQRYCVGQSWQTHVPVVTSLGSGVASIVHTIARTANGRAIEVDVKGTGIISGLEYNLPRLLPGAIGITGKAWYDPLTGVITREQYVLHNRLIRTTKGKTIGFLETETVDVTTNVSR
jgi:hypothetical protein